MPRTVLHLPARAAVGEGAVLRVAQRALPQEAVVFHALAHHAAGEHRALAAHGHDLLAAQDLLRDDRREPAEHVLAAVDDDDLLHVAPPSKTEAKTEARPPPLSPC